MGSKEEAVVRSLYDCYRTGDRAALLDLYADDAVYHVWAWHKPFVGRDAIRAELDRQFDLVSDYRTTILNIFSKGAVVFTEIIDTFKHSGKDVTMHGASGVEVNPAGKITAQRDYSDSQELKQQLG
jgi:ketosteroid isomerase-like protein